MERRNRTTTIGRAMERRRSHARFLVNHPVEARRMAEAKYGKTQSNERQTVTPIETLPAQPRTRLQKLIDGIKDRFSQRGHKV